MTKITGTNSIVHFDLENGYSVTGTGELLVDGKFAVDTDSLKKWDPPNEEKPFTASDLARIEAETKERMGTNTVQIIFD